VTYISYFGLLSSFIDTNISNAWDCRRLTTDAPRHA
jgi:hypothetical protein